MGIGFVTDCVLNEAGWISEVVITGSAEAFCGGLFSGVEVGSLDD